MSEANQQFDTHDQWVNKASYWLTSHPDYRPQGHHNSFRAICFDAKGRLCRNGGDFAKARDEDAFPVRWFWPDQVGPLALAATELCKACEEEMMDIKAQEGDPLWFPDDEGVSISKDADGNTIDSPITFGMIRRLHALVGGG